MAKKKAKSLTKAHNGWVPKGETLRETLEILEIVDVGVVYSTRRKCLDDIPSPNSGAIRRRVTITVEDI